MSSPPQADPCDRRRLLIVIGAAAVLAIALVATLLSKPDEEGSSAAAAGFEPVYERLEERRTAAGVSTMGEPADPDAHLHPNLALYAEGTRIQIPVNIGIDPSEPPERMASLHTHETDGTIHLEGMSEATLEQFFAIWGVPFSKEQLGPYETDGEKSIGIWVDGQPSDQFEQLKLADGQGIVVAYGTPEQLAAASP